jgi:hypothetical protein
MITLFLQGQKLTLAQTVIAADAVNYLTARLIYKTADWMVESLSVWVHFRLGETQIDAESVGGEIGTDAGVNLTAGVWTVWVTGHVYEGSELIQRITTETAELTVKESGVTDGEPLPTGSFGETILGEVRDIYRAVGETLNEAAEEMSEQLDAQNHAVDERLAENEETVAGMLGKVKNERDGSFIKLWAGTEDQYSAATKNSDTIYLVGMLGGDNA